MDPSLILLALPLVLLVFMFTAQRKRQRAFAQLQDRLSPGQDVVTTSGLFARLVRLDEAVAVLEISPGQQVRWDRRAIASVLGEQPGQPGPGPTSTEGGDR